MLCIKCQQKTQVINSRHSAQKALVWRRRNCKSCGYTMTTYESPATDQLIVVKKDREESFDSTRLLLSIARCFEHLPDKQAENARGLSENVTYKLIDKNGDKFSCEELVLTAFNTLKSFDRLAAVQYGARHSGVLKPYLRHL